MIRVLLACLLLAGCAEAPWRAAAPEPRSEPAPAAAGAGSASATVPPPAGTAPGGMVAAAHPEAVEAGLAMLRAGGSAVDAAAAVQAALGLVEPQSSGIGGGAFIVHYDAETRAVTVYDGREAAPAAAGPELFFKPDGTPMGFREAWTSGRSPGAPGAIDALRLAHADHGRLDWAALFDPAIALAEDGFAVTPRLNRLVGLYAQYGPLDERPETRAYFFDAAGEPLPVGHVLTNPAYADTLRAIAADPRALLEGPIAADIVAAARAAPFGSSLTREDLRSYAAERREAVCRPYRAFLVCSAPPPSSGGVALNSALGVLETLPIRGHGPDSAQGWHLFIEAMRLAYADRDRYVADPDFVEVPVDALLDDAYLARRAALVDPGRAIGSVAAGDPFAGAEAFGADSTEPAPGTSHLVVVDGAGDVVSMTTTVESGFGSHIWVRGFLLNNQLTDFAREAHDADGRLLANAPGPGKRPRSSMSPAIVLDADSRAFVLATGSPGGNSIIAYVLKTLVGVLDWGLTPQAAAELPNVVARGDTVRIETGFPAAIAEALRAMGHDVAEPEGENSGVHAVMVAGEGLVGAADPRREGVAATP